MPEQSNIKDTVSTSRKLGIASWRVLKSRRALLKVSILSFVATCATALIVGALGVGLIIATHPHIFSASQNGEFSLQIESWKLYLLGALLLISTTLVSTYFNGALAHGFLRSFEGKSANTTDMLRAASRHKIALLNFGLLNITVGLVLRIIEERVPLAGRIAVWLAGAGWSVATVFAVPVAMESNEQNPLKVVKRSAQLFIDVWAQSAFIGISLGLISTAFQLLISFVIVASIGILIGFGATVVTVSMAIVLVVLGLFASIALALVMTTLRTIAMTSAYYYATRKKIPEGFDQELVRGMFKPKKKWLS